MTCLVYSIVCASTAIDDGEQTRKMEMMTSAKCPRVSYLRRHPPSSRNLHNGSEMEMIKKWTIILLKFYFSFNAMNDM